MIRKTGHLIVTNLFYIVKPRPRSYGGKLRLALVLCRASRAPYSARDATRGKWLVCSRCHATMGHRGKEREEGGGSGEVRNSNNCRRHIASRSTLCATRADRYAPIDARDAHGKPETHNVHVRGKERAVTEAMTVITSGFVTLNGSLHGSR